MVGCSHLLRVVTDVYTHESDEMIMILFWIFSSSEVLSVAFNAVFYCSYSCCILAVRDLGLVFTGSPLEQL